MLVETQQLEPFGNVHRRRGGVAGERDAVRAETLKRRFDIVEESEPVCAYLVEGGIPLIYRFTRMRL
ncbi:MAG: hypothetical protein Q4B08_02650 [Propionibacteriaceae bacterium]|nr:hypothetical protein [Propionibacteriaceae bacterium]